MTRLLTWSMALVWLLAAADGSLGAGGTLIVAQQGKPATIADHLPAGIAAIINHPQRTTGWNSWFTEWPNDVCHYALEVESTAEINDLLKKLAAVESQVRQVRLSYEKEPAALGWVTQVPKGNAIPVVFSIGNQQRIDQWYERVDKPFGKIEFAGPPVAVPPTLTIYAPNQAVDLNELEIPEGLELSMGGVPGVFHRWNRTDEQEVKQTSEEEARQLEARREAQLDGQQKAAKLEIAKLVKEYAERAKQAADNRDEKPE